MCSFKIIVALRLFRHPVSMISAISRSKCAQVTLLALAITLGAGWMVGFYYALSEVANTLASVAAPSPR